MQDRISELREDAKRSYLAAAVTNDDALRHRGGLQLARADRLEHITKKEKQVGLCMATVGFVAVGAVVVEAVRRGLGRSL